MWCWFDCFVGSGCDLYVLSLVLLFLVCSCDFVVCWFLLLGSLSLLLYFVCCVSCCLWLASFGGWRCCCGFCVLVLIAVVVACGVWCWALRFGVFGLRFSVFVLCFCVLWVTGIL